MPSVHNLFIAHDDTAAPAPEGIAPGAMQRVLFKNYGKTPALYRGIHAQCSYWPTEFPTPKFLPDKWEPSVVVGINEPIGPSIARSQYPQTQLPKLRAATAIFS